MSKANVALTGSEISEFNTEFFNNEADTMNNMLLSSEYTSPEGIERFHLFYGGINGLVEQASEEEVRLLTEMDSEDGQWEVMLQKIQNGYLFVSNVRAD